MHPVAAALELDDLGVVEEAIEHRAGGGGVAEQLPPVLDGTVGADHRRPRLVPPGEDLEEVLGGRRWQATHAEILDHDQADPGQSLDQLAAGPQGRGLGQVLDEVEGGAVMDGVAGVDRRQRQAQADMALADAGWPDEQDAGALGDEAAGGQVDDQRFGHLGVEAPVEVVEGLHLGQPRLLDAPLQEPVLPTVELILHQQVEEVDVGKVVADRLLVAHRQGRGHAGKTEVAQAAVEVRLHGVVSQVVEVMDGSFRGSPARTAAGV